MLKRFGCALATLAGSVALTLTLAPAPSQAAPTTLGDALAATSPTYLYRLDDAAGSTSAAEAGTRRPLRVVDEPFTQNATGDGPVTFDGTAASFGGGQFLHHGPAVRLNNRGDGADGQRSFTLETTFTAPTDIPYGTETLVRASRWTISLSTNGAGAVFVGWLDRGNSADGSSGRLDTADVATGVHQVVAVGVGLEVTVYVDGREAFTRPMLPLRRGQLAVGSFNGQAAGNVLAAGATERDVAAWKRPLTAEEISSLWAAASS